MGLEMIKLKDLLNEKKSKHGKLVATIKKGNDVYELYNDIRWGGYSTPIIVKNGKEIKQYGVNMYTKPAIKKFEKEFGGKAKLESVNEAISWGQLKTFLISVSRSGAKNMDGVKINPQTAKAILDYGNSSVSNRKKLEKLPIKKMISLVTEESVNEAIPKFPRINMGFGEAQDYSKMMIKKSEVVFKSTRGGDLGKAKKAVKDMEEIVVQIKRVLGI